VRGEDATEAAASSRFPRLAAESFLYSIANVFTQQTFAPPYSLHPLLDTLRQQGEAVSHVRPDQDVRPDWLPAQDRQLPVSYCHSH
jgi:hypothetical protein